MTKHEEEPRQGAGVFLAFVVIVGVTAMLFFFAGFCYELGRKDMRLEYLERKVGNP